jgi:AraC family transcriptional activator of pobA
LKLKITSKTLYNATTQLLGKAPKQLIDDRILLESKRLLIHTNATIKEIGFELGFIEPTNFIKFFRKYERMTPTAGSKVAAIGAGLFKKDFIQK